jgi:hypothetical protein
VPFLLSLVVVGCGQGFLGSTIPVSAGQRVGTGEPMPARQDVASYQLVARWEPSTNQIHGSGVITYQNPSADPIGDLHLKLYLNAFRDASTPWMREAKGDPRSLGFKPDQPGWIKLEALQLVDTGEDILPANAATANTTLQVPLPMARTMKPGDRIRIRMRWTSQLPRVFARTGVAGDFVMAGQWYPKLAVYDRGQWDYEPWHANSEFFADFGEYSLDLTVPSSYVTGASGVREGSEQNTDGTTTTRYHAESVSDIAWTAWPGYRMATRAVDAAGQIVELELLAPRTLDTSADERVFRAAEVALDRYGRWFGVYPWPKLTLIVPPSDASSAGGMEYPTLVTLDPPTDLPFGAGDGIRDVEIVTVHEIAHQWVPMQLATDEGREAWLDEGFADYATVRVLRTMFDPAATLLDIGPAKLSYETVHRAQYVLIGDRQRLDQPSWLYPDALTYVATVYSKGMLTFQTLERVLGEDRFLTAFRAYFDRWRWRHPTAADLERALEDTSGVPLDWLFEPLVYGTDLPEFGVESVDASGATLTRRGELSFPVGVALTYADGRVQPDSWSGAYERPHYSANGGMLAEVNVDPDHVVRVEPDLMDDGRTVGPQRAVLTALGARILVALQAMLLAAGMLG